MVVTFRFEIPAIVKKIAQNLRWIFFRTLYIMSFGVLALL